MRLLLGDLGLGDIGMPITACRVACKTLTHVPHCYNDDVPDAAELRVVAVSADTTFIGAPTPPLKQKPNRKPAATTSKRSKPAAPADRPELRGRTNVPRCVLADRREQIAAFAAIEDEDVDPDRDELIDKLCAIEDADAEDAEDADDDDDQDDAASCSDIDSLGFPCEFVDVDAGDAGPHVGDVDPEVASPLSPPPAVPAVTTASSSASVAATAPASSSASIEPLSASLTRLRLTQSKLSFPFDISQVTSAGEVVTVARAHKMWGTTVKFVCKNKHHRSCHLMMLASWFGGFDEATAAGLEWAVASTTSTEDEHYGYAQRIVKRGRASAAARRA